MTAASRRRIRRALLYASKTLLGGLICWYGLIALGVSDPVWAVITVMIVSDPDLSTAVGLAQARIINTSVGCLIGFASLALFGYSPLLPLVAAAVTVSIVILIDHYPTNWRLAPVTVYILVDAGRMAATYAEELELALKRAGEIAFGCGVALLLAFAYTRLIGAWSASHPQPPAAGGD